MMRISRAFLALRRTLPLSSVVAQGPSTSSDPAGIKSFYSSFTYDNAFQKVEVPDMSAELLPFQKEGVGWMAQREMNHIGGIMADHLGMGKTVQMIGLCLVSDRVNKLLLQSNSDWQHILAEGNRLMTVLRQLQKISVVANCSRINRPAKDLKAIAVLIDDAIRKKSSDFSAARSEIDKWLEFAGKFHPTYSKRAEAFLNDEEKRSFSFIDSKELRTLVVVPAALMLQWKSELENKVKKERGLTIYLYHGENKWISHVEMETYDFVITTYDTLTNSTVGAFLPGDDGRTYAFNRREAGPLFHIQWKRIILDEAHMIRHTRTNRWRAVQELQGLHRWAVTATPLHNSIEDLQNLLTFVGLPRLPVLPGSPSDELLNDVTLQSTIARSLQPAFLRRGPVMIRNGVREVLVRLPKMTEVVSSQQFTEKESAQYNEILAKSRSALASSTGTVKGGGSLHIFAMMTRLRQACCHPWTSQGRVVTISVCGICNSEAVSAVVTKCGHTFCSECLLLRFREALDGDELAARVACPTCETMVTFNSVFKRQGLTSSERLEQFRENEFELSTKLKMILKAIYDMNKNTPDDKMIIFSHFTSFMDVISVALERYGVEYLRIDGTMPLTQRNTTIRHFQSSPTIKIVLASKTATGVGLNLTAANHVLVVDPWWNPAIEEQAIHRCYRIGQTKDVHVTRFIISDTIEQYCYEICQKKKEFGDAILRAATAGDANARAATSKLQELMSRLQYVESGKDKDSGKPSAGASSDEDWLENIASVAKSAAAAAAAAQVTPPPPPSPAQTREAPPAPKPAARKRATKQGRKSAS